jgi:hypothetical protein
MNATIELSDEKAAALKAQLTCRQPTRKSGSGNSMPG